MTKLLTKSLKYWLPLWCAFFSLAVQTGGARAQTAACAKLSYQAALSYEFRLGALEALPGDFNGDDLTDLIVAGNSGSEAFFLPGDGTGRLDAAASIPLPKGLSSLTAGDFNNDAIPDLAGITFGDGLNYNLSLLFGDGTGRFRDSGLTLNVYGPAHFTAADFNGDGRLDLALCNFSDGRVTIHTGEGAGRFSSGVVALQTARPTFILASDFNGDGKADLAVASQGANNVAVLLGEGAGRFTAAPPVSVEADPYFLLAADFNRDGRRDLLALKRSPGQFQYLLGDGAGRFLNLGGRDLNSGGRAALGDLNQDGLPDLVAVSPAGTAVYLNNGGNGFAPPLNLGVVGGGALTLADFNNDGQLDLVSFGQDGGRGKVLLTLGAGGGRFATPQVQTTTPAGANVELADFNQDGNVDLAVASASLTIHLGDSAGRFTPANIYSAGRFPRQMAVADFNGDARLDLALAVDGDNQVVLFQGDGRGGFANGPAYPAGSGTSYLAAGDFNGDGQSDLAVNSYANNNVLVLLNTSANGVSSFAAPIASPAGTSPRTLAVADFNRDGKLDLAAASLPFSTSDPNSVALLLGDGAGRFTLSTTFTPGAPYRLGPLAAGDFDGDGEPELAAALGSENSFTTPHALGVLRFRSPTAMPVLTTFPVGAVTNDLTVQDFNGDGRPDLALASQDFTGVTLLFNDGRGGFARRSSYFFGQNAATLAAGDLNKDGRADLLVTHGGTSGFSVIFSACAAAPPFVTASAASYRSARLAPAALAVVFGAGLAQTTEVARTVPLPTTLAGTSVHIKDAEGRERPAPLFFVSPAQINFQLPAETAPGAATVTIQRANGAPLSSVTQIDRVVPALFSADASGQGWAAAVAVRVKADGAQVFEPIVRFDAAQNRLVAVPLEVGKAAEQVFLSLFGTGLRNRSARAAVTGAVGGERVEVSFAGAQGSLIGVDQVNLRLPPQLAGRGEVGIVVTADGKTTNTVKVSIR